MAPEAGGRTGMLMRKRGAPVLVELMKGRPAEAVGAPRPAPAAAAPPAPLPRLARADDAEAAPPPRLGPEPAAGPWWTRPWYLAAGAIAIVLAVWAMAYSLGRAEGQRAGEDKIRQVVSADPLARAPVSDPLANPVPPAGAVPAPHNTGPTASAPGTPGPRTDAARHTPRPEPRPSTPSQGASTTSTPPVPTAPAPTAPTSTPTGPDSLPPASAGVATTLQVGLNYLVVADLGKDDAEAAAAYLRGKGVPAGLVPQRSTVQVVVLRGYPGEVFADRKPERAKIEALVKKLGRDWKVENRRAPTDFAQVFWAKLRE